VNALDLSLDSTAAPTSLATPTSRNMRRRTEVATIPETILEKLAPPVATAVAESNETVEAVNPPSRRSSFRLGEGGVGQLPAKREKPPLGEGRLRCNHLGGGWLRGFLKRGI